MKILLVAKNAMGDVADYEVDADTQQEVYGLVYLLIGRPGIVSVKVHPDYIDKVHGLPRSAG
jgi:hypothetical protein